MPTKKKLEPNHAAVPARAWERYIAARATIDEWQAVVDEARAEIEAAMGDNEVGVLDGETVVTWATRKESRFNRAAFAKAHPELEAEFVEIQSRRYFVPIR